MSIEIRRLHKHFGIIHANNDINLTLNHGEIVGILGENGAGKSTLMKILSGFLQPDDGEIYIDGHIVNYTGPETAIKHGIGMLHQVPLDIGAFTVLENFMFGTQTAVVLRRRQARFQMEEIAKRLGLELNPDLLISSLTIAERQQVEIIRLLAKNVHTLILDEPTTSISAAQKKQLFDTLRHLAKVKETLIIFVSHKLDDVTSLCDSVYVLRSGRVVGKRNLPAPSMELVKMMFGQEFVAHTRSKSTFNDTYNTIEMEDITVNGSRSTVQNFSLRVRQGEIVGFAGLERSGQELVLRAAAGLIPITAGRIQINKNDLTRKEPFRFWEAGVRFCGTERLESGLVSGLTIVEHYMLVKKEVKLINWQFAVNLTKKLLAQFRVRGEPSNRINDLSGGHQQRLLLALMSHRASALILESPTQGLDFESSIWIWKQLLYLCSLNTCIIFSSTDLNELALYSDRIFVFNGNNIIEVPDVQNTTEAKLGQLMSAIA